MKEFRIEAEVKGRWFVAHNPFCNPIPVFKTKEEAAERLIETKRAWEEYEKTYAAEKNGHIPTNFRIGCREVTEWETVEI